MVSRPYDELVVPCLTQYYTDNEKGSDYVTHEGGGDTNEGVQNIDETHKEVDQSLLVDLDHAQSNSDESRAIVAYHVGVTTPLSPISKSIHAEVSDFLRTSTQHTGNLNQDIAATIRMHRVLTPSPFALEGWSRGRLILQYPTCVARPRVRA
jgi:hypothetical protein